MAVERKGALPALMHAHAAWQTQILASQPKNMALCADRPDVEMLSTMRPDSSAWWEQALMLRCPFSLGLSPPASSSVPGCQHMPAALQSVSE